MRTSTLVLFFLLVSVIALGQQHDASKPKKVLTPEQQEYQQESRKVGDERNRLRAAAEQAFDAEMAREKAGDCLDARTTIELNICMGHEADTTDDNYKAFAEAIRSMLGLKDPPFPGSKEQPPQNGIAGPILTPEQFVAEFDKV